MMSNTSVKAPVPARSNGKIFLQMVIGGIAGFLAMMGAMTAFRAGFPAKPTPDQALAIGVGVVYVMMGLFVVLGAIVPTLGAKLLNVADAEELRDDKGYLVWSALVCVVFGVAVIVAALAAPTVGIVAPEIALGLFIAALLFTMIAWRKMRGGQDEFRRLINAESSQAGLVLVMLVFGGWAVMAQLGFAPMFTPLAFVAGFLALILVGAFVVIFQRGLLVR